MTYETKPESGIEKIPRRDDVIKVFEQYVTGFKVVYEQFDQYGPALLDVEVAGEEIHETIRYCYMRKGDFSGQPARSKTTIHVVFCANGVEIGGYNLTEYNYDTLRWEEQNKPPKSVVSKTI